MTFFIFHNSQYDLNGDHFLIFLKLLSQIIIYNQINMDEQIEEQENPTIQ